MNNVKCPRCNGSVYKDFDGLTCLMCGHTIIDAKLELWGDVWREAHAAASGLPPSVQRHLDAIVPRRRHSRPNQTSDPDELREAMQRSREPSCLHPNLGCKGYCKAEYACND